MAIPLILAGLLTKLAENGLNLIGNAVINKGKDYVEKELGVSLDASTTSEAGLIQLQQLQNDKEEFLLNAALEDKKVELDYYKVDAEDRNSARGMNEVIQASLNATWIAKTLPYWLDLIIVASTLLLVGMIFYKAIPPENKELAYTAFGALLAMCGTILHFHRGTSSSSAKKDTTIHNLSGASK